MASVVKDTGEIWARLFDHRPFIRGEVIFFQREFEDKRNDREAKNLLKIVEKTTELHSDGLVRTKQLGDRYLHGLQANVEVVLSMCEKVLQKETNIDKDILRQNREIRRAEWVKFIDDMNEKCQKVDQTFEENAQQIQQYYQDLEIKLNIN